MDRRATIAIIVCIIVALGMTIVLVGVRLMVCARDRYMGEEP